MKISLLERNISPNMFVGIGGMFFTIHFILAQVGFLEYNPIEVWFKIGSYIISSV